ncbi:MAG: MarR family transcriptional regulator [bacterium]|nr:MarR family transcriptional regulator [bacterium]
MRNDIQRRSQKIVNELPTIMRFFHHFSAKVLNEAELTLPQFQTFSAFSFQEEWNLTDLSKYLQIKLPATSELVDRLVKADLLSRKQNPLDRRKTMISLTKKGKQFLQRRRKRLLTGYERLLTKLSLQDQKRIERAFGELYRIALTYQKKV